MPAASDIIDQRSQPQKRGDPPGAARRHWAMTMNSRLACQSGPKGTESLQAANHNPHQLAPPGDTVTSDSQNGLCSDYVRRQGYGICVMIGRPRSCPCRVSTAAGRLSSLRHSTTELLELLSPINFVFHSVLHLHFQRIKRFIHIGDCAQVDLVPTSPQFASSS